MDEMLQKLLVLWDRADRPSSRSLARDVAGISHTTIAETLNGSRVPSKMKYRTLVEALDGDWSEFDELFRDHLLRSAVDLQHPLRAPDPVLQELRAIRRLLEQHLGLRPDVT